MAGSTAVGLGELCGTSSLVSGGRKGAFLGERRELFAEALRVLGER